MELQFKTATVTGGGRGIGRATALALAQQGCNVAICSRTSKELKEVEKHVNSKKTFLAKKCDVRNSNQVKNFVQDTMRKFKTIDVLVNNAGAGYFKSLRETTEKDYDETFDTNVRGVFNFCKETVPIMLKSNRRCFIVNISSGSGKKGYAKFSAYCASKFAVIGFTESIAEELAPNILVYAICPGPVDTKMYYDLFREHPPIKPEDVAGKIIDTIINPPVSGASIDVI